MREPNMEFEMEAHLHADQKNHYRQPLIASVCHPDGPEEIHLIMEGNDRFQDEADLEKDYRAIAEAVLTAAAGHLNLPIDVLCLEGITIPDAPVVDWRVEGLWAGGDDGNWGDIVSAPNSVLALLAAHQTMTGNDQDYGQPTAGMEEVERVLANMRNNTIFPPIPMVLRDEQMLALLTSFDAKIVGGELSEEIAQMIAISQGKPVDYRGPRDHEGEMMLSFYSDDDALRGKDLTVFVPYVDFTERFGEPGDYREVDTDEDMEMFVKECRNAAIARHVEPSDALISSTSFTEIGRVGPLFSFQIDAVWWGQASEGPWSDTVWATDHDDSIMQAEMAMASATPGHSDISDIVLHFGAHHINTMQVMPTGDLDGLLRRLAARSDLPGEAASAAAAYREALRHYEVVLGIDRIAAAAPTM